LELFERLDELELSALPEASGVLLVAEEVLPDAVELLADEVDAAAEDEVLLLGWAPELSESSPPPPPPQAVRMPNSRLDSR